MLNPVFISAPFVYFPLSFRVLIFFIFFSAVFLLSFERQVNFFNVHFSHATFVRLRHLLTFNHDTFPHFLFVFFLLSSIILHFLQSFLSVRIFLMLFVPFNMFSVCHLSIWLENVEKRGSLWQQTKRTRLRTK